MELQWEFEVRKDRKLLYRLRCASSMKPETYSQLGQIEDNAIKDIVQGEKGTIQYDRK